MLIPILSWILFGLIVGAIARFAVPGPQPMGILGTMLLGIAGSFIGGFVAYLIVGGSALQAVGWIGSILGAVALVALGQFNQRRITP